MKEAVRNVLQYNQPLGSGRVRRKIYRGGHLRRLPTDDGTEPILIGGVHPHCRHLDPSVQVSEAHPNKLSLVISGREVRHHLLFDGREEVLTFRAQ